MSVLNQSGEEQVECPLCMEPLEVDDLTFFPCTCGYQICRFCWHRIRTDENGLCPACRKAYPEDPAGFKPLSQEEVARLKAEKRHKDQQRKQKISENRKHLANVRVVQKNLVFVVGLPMRLADPETLKKHDYFGKFGKIHKVVINQSTSYAGSQGPSASAYVTYNKSDDALRAIQAVNNIFVDGRTVKTSLGTTKYCSHFMKNQACPKVDCMYLHELGDAEASFTKEEMQQGKHQEYEKKLHEQLNSNGRKPTPSPPTVPNQQANCKEAWPSLNNQNPPVLGGVAPSSSPQETPLISQPQVNNGFKTDNKKQNNFVKHKSRNCSSEDNRKNKETSSTNHRIQETFGDMCSERSGGGGGGGGSKPNLAVGRKESCPQSETEAESQRSDDYRSHNGITTVEHNGYGQAGTGYCQELSPGYKPRNGGVSPQHSPVTIRPLSTSLSTENHLVNLKAQSLFPSDSNSFFSSDTFLTVNNLTPGNVTNWHMNGVSNSHSPEVSPVPNHADTWQQPFSYSSKQREEDSCARDDDLGFDPFHETQKALAEMIEKEEQHRYQPKIRTHHNNRINNCTKLLDGLRLGTTVAHSRPPPPGFTSTPNHMNAFGLGIPRTGSKILPFINPTTVAFPTHTSQPAPGWDWPSLDPAIVTSAQHCDLYTGNPPPGFTIRQTLDNL